MEIQKDTNQQEPIQNPDQNESNSKIFDLTSEEKNLSEKQNESQDISSYSFVTDNFIEVDLKKSKIVNMNKLLKEKNIEVPINDQNQYKDDGDSKVVGRSHKLLMRRVMDKVMEDDEYTIPKKVKIDTSDTSESTLTEEIIEIEDEDENENENEDENENEIENEEVVMTSDELENSESESEEFSAGDYDYSDDFIDDSEIMKFHENKINEIYDKPFKWEGSLKTAINYDFYTKKWKNATVDECNNSLKRHISDI